MRRAGVSVCGATDRLPQIVELVDGIIARKKHVIMCTNAILLDRFLQEGAAAQASLDQRPSGRHAEDHDYVVDRAGIFDKAVAMIKEGSASATTS